MKGFASHFGKERKPPNRYIDGKASLERAKEATKEPLSTFVQKILDKPLDRGNSTHKSEPRTGARLSAIDEETNNEQKQAVSLKEKTWAENVKADLNDILKKSTENSVSKAKAIDARHELERLMMSATKGAASTPFKKQHQEDDQNYIPEPENHSEESLDTMSIFFKKMIDADQSSNIEEQSSESKEQRHSRASKSLMEMLQADGIGNETTVQFDSNKILMLGEKEDGQINLMKEGMEMGNQHQTNDIKTIHINDDKPKSTLEKLEMDGDKRSRQSYFPEKLLRKVKVDTEDFADEDKQADDELIDSITQQLRGPFFEAYSTSSKESRLVDLFSKSNIQKDQMTTFDEVANRSLELDDIHSRVNDIQIHKLSTFGDELSEMLAMNHS